MGAETRRSPISMTPFVKNSSWFVIPAVHYELNELYAHTPLVFLDGDGGRRSSMTSKDGWNKT